MPTFSKSKPKIKKDEKRKLTSQEMDEILSFLNVDEYKNNPVLSLNCENIKTSSRKSLENIVIYPSGIEELKIQIRNHYIKSLVQPGHMVGVDAACSIGQPITQLSTAKWEKIIIQNNENNEITMINSTIGDFIDNLLEENIKNVKTHDNSSILSTFNKDIKIISVSKDEKITWSKITEVSRHPPNGNLVKVTTVTGREVTCTLSHSFLKRTVHGIEPILGSDLKIGDKIPVCLNISNIDKPITDVDIPEYGDDILQVPLTRSFGEFLGIFVAEGSTCISSNTIAISSNVEYYQNLAIKKYKEFTDNKIGTRITEQKICGSKKSYKATNTFISCAFLSRWLREECGEDCYTKKVPSFLFGSEKKFISSFLRALFDGDGNISGHKKSVKYHSTSKDLIEQVALLLSYFGISCTYHVEKEIREEIDNETGKVYKFAKLWVLLIYGPENGKKFYDNINTNIDHKREELKTYIYDKKRNEIDSIPYCAKYIDRVGRGLKLPGASENYSRWLKKESENKWVGRRALKNYIDIFSKNDIKKKYIKEINYLKQGAYSDVLWDKIISLKIIVPDKYEYVYDFSVENTETFALQSGILVHNTLNSIDYEERIVVKKGLIVTWPKIGDFVDNFLKNNEEKIQKLEENKTDYLEINENLEVPCVDEDGKMHWKKIEAVTRHLPPDGDKLLLVKTQMGRSVIATKAKSFLTRKENKIVGTNGSDLKVGDRIPITISLPEVVNPINEIKLEDYLDKREYVFGTDLWKAREIRDEYKNSKKSSWWSKNHGIKFTLPYTRSDGAMKALEGEKKELVGKEYIKPYLVYNKYTVLCKEDRRGIPEIIKLDKDFGFFIGAYLAEGHCSNTGYQLIISNNDAYYRQRIIDWCVKHNLTYHILIKKDTQFKGNLGYDVRIHSQLLVSLIKRICSNYSHLKYIPEFAVMANKDFRSGLLDGYFSGDGWVTDNNISCSSVSELLIDGINLLLSTFGILAKKTKPKLVLKNNVDSKNILQAYLLTISCENVKTFHENISFTVKYKQDKIDFKVKKKFIYVYGKNDIIPGIELSNGLSIEKHRDYLSKNLENIIENEKDKNILLTAINSEVYFDEITSIEKIESSHENVYDLTVADTRNFNLFNGLCAADSFHHIGTTNLTLISGVPRMEELLNVTKSQKQNSLSFKLNKDFSTPLSIKLNSDLLKEEDPSKTEHIKNEILFNKINSFKRYSRIEFEKKLIMDFLESEPEVLHKKYDNLDSKDKLWYKLFDTCYNKDYKKYEWGTRLIFKKNSIYHYKLDMKKISKMIEDNENGGFTDVLCVFSPNNIGIIDVYIDTSIENPEDFLIKLSKKKGKKKLEDDRENIYIWNNNSKYYYYIRDLLIGFLKCIKVSGIEGIDKVYIQEDLITKEWQIDTLGTNLRMVMSHPTVVFKTIKSNNPWEIFKIFGIESLRNMLIDNFNQVISNGSSNLSRTHLELLIDSMTRRGIITPVSRDGVLKDEAGPLTRASFEQSSDNMLIAAKRGEVESVSSVSASIILGQSSKLGSGIINLKLDIDMILKNKKLPQIQDSEFEEYVELF